MTATLETTSADVVARLYTALPEKFTGDNHTPETPAEMNSVWFILKNIDNPDARSLCVAMFAHDMTDNRWHLAIRLAGESQFSPAAHELFVKAKTHLKYPKIVLETNGLTCVIKLLGPASNNAGCLTITNGKRYGAIGYRWYGLIDPQGRFDRKRSCPDAITDLLTAFVDDPVVVTAANGKLTGNCCFCRKALSDPRSTTVGYGLVCSRHWGLPWGI